ncbi:MAG: NAD(P)/FAD-dependent oxidoreductase [Verrucomicrobia bacterium]|nr:NAD(P)/FAD-dependent oxidoreductase [Verrucomicrobiota bacterium]
MKRIVIIGGGAAGIFAAIHCAPFGEVILLEKTRQLLAKVRISGGGRCNVTHAAFDPKKLIMNYPRGNRELLGPFHHFGPQEIIAWFESRGVSLKTEEDGRIFPTTDHSATIINCLLSAAKEAGVQIRQEVHVQKIEDHFLIHLDKGEPISCDALILATGSSPSGHTLAASLGHTIIPPVPSLFTFNVPTSDLLDLSGIVAHDVELSILGFRQRGDLLLTHWGFSGPAALKLSAWAARELSACHYKADLTINWLPDLSLEEIQRHIKEKRNLLPQNLWKRLGSASKLHASTYAVEGKTTNKQEFVTCGGVDLKEVDMRTMESKKVKHLYFAGEILNIDGVTGGFNFQNAWTTGYLAANAITSR